MVTKIRELQSKNDNNQCVSCFPYFKDCYYFSRDGKCLNRYFAHEVSKDVTDLRNHTKLDGKNLC